MSAHRCNSATFTEYLKGASDRAVLTPPLNAPCSQSRKHF